MLKLGRYLRAELMLVLGTSSSESALPSLMEKMEKAGCDKSVVGLVVPTGYSFNLDGTNIYMTLAALFIAQATNTHLTLGHQVALLLVAMLSSKGAAGVTGAGFITLAATLAVVPEVPVAGMAADPGRGPLHERVPLAHQLHGQRRGHRGGVALGEGAGPWPARCGAERPSAAGPGPGPGCRNAGGRRGLIAPIMG
ncbi:C4-dicarboxylate transporter DctA [Alicycliphilus sp. B1]|nr:C4-dicarboxylate transporter DctA [Alicycliphilus sp. B1]